MAELLIDTVKIQKNIAILGDYFSHHTIRWSLITKVFSGDLDFLKAVLTPEVIQSINSVGDSRLSSLKNLKTVNPDMRTIYIKPPAKIYADEVVRYADISLNTSFSTILALNEQAVLQNKIHQVIIMIELGELREGVNQEDIVDFYEKIFSLSNIEVIGIGSNLGCMYGIEPTQEKLNLLVHYKHLIDRKFNTFLPLISGGSSITLPLIERDELPESVNHFRVGEAAFFGISPLTGKQFLGLHTDAFRFRANIIEIEEKHLVPDGIISDANIGHTAELDESEKNRTSNKAILDFGLLDIDKSDIETSDPDLTFVGVTSDMLVVDIGENKNPDGSKKYAVGGFIEFIPNYMGVARLLNSKFIDKQFI